MLRAVIALLTLLTLQGGAAAQTQRRAFVIGIGEYRELQDIVRPVGDARAVHDRLSQLGFTSELVVDADGPTLQDAFNRFTASLQDGDVAVVYFSGHAGRVGGEFTLLAADAPLQGTRERRQQPFGLLLTTIADIRVAGAQAQIFFIDACRGDPYVSSPPEFGASSCGELKEPLPEGSLALFSASAGQRALDRLGDSDQDPHSIFTRTLLGHLRDAGPVVRLARSVRTEVIELANSVQYQQTPAYLDELVGPPVVLVPSPSDLASVPTPPSAPALPRVPPPPPPQPQPQPQPQPHPPPAATDGFACGSATPGPPTFDCGRARLLAEIAICRDPRLGSCDRILNAAFYEAQARAGRGAVALRRDQEAWLARRDACTDFSP